jgi:effector-binding domain-containing protein
MEYQISVAQHATQKALVITQSLAREDIREYLDAAFPELVALLAQRGVKAAGPPFARYRVDADTFHVTAGIPVPNGVEGSGRVRLDELPGGDIASTVHVGSYEELPAAFHAVIEWLPGAGYTITGDPWESYLDQPDVPQPRTQVNFPVTRRT